MRLCPVKLCRSVEECILKAILYRIAIIANELFKKF